MFLPVARGDIWVVDTHHSAQPQGETGGTGGTGSSSALSAGEPQQVDSLGTRQVEILALVVCKEGQGWHLPAASSKELGTGQVPEAA